MPKVVIIGAGLIGCASAMRLAMRGADVTVLDRTEFGEQAASRRAAGILGAQIEAHEEEAMAKLCVESRERFADWVPELEQASGVDVEYRVSGVLQLAFDEAQGEGLQKELERQRGMGLQAELLDGAAVHALEPGLAQEVTAGLLFAADGLVDPPHLLQAARLGAERNGASFRFGAGVARVELRHGKVEGVVLDDGGKLPADTVVVAAGSWSSLIKGLPMLPRSSVRPARGQMVVVHFDEPPLSRVVSCPDVYLSPRRDGRVLVGSTVEHVGYDDAVTAGAVASLLSAAVRVLPKVRSAPVGATWSGFRAETPDRMPIFGDAGIEGLVLATGHFRDGVVLAPISAEIVSALVYGETPPVDLTPFAAGRFAGV